jgi:hypothetical protein
MGVTSVFRWDSLPNLDTFKAAEEDCSVNDACNETVELPLNNPAGAASMILTFSMPHAQNDWWWAIDNIVVTADVAGAVSAEITDPTDWNFSTSEGGVGIPGDIDGDGEVQFSDFVILANNFGMSAAALLPVPAAAADQVFASAQGGGEGDDDFDDMLLQTL